MSGKAKKRKRSFSKSGSTVHTSFCKEVGLSSSVNGSTATESSASSPVVTNFATSSSFEDELSWCLNQLQLSVKGKEQSKQRRILCDKSYKILISKKTPLPRKRQLMRNLFGDYRAKMKTVPLSNESRQTSGPVSECTEPKTQSKYYRSSVSKMQVSTPVTRFIDTVGTDEIESFQFRFDISPDMLREY